MQNGGGSEDGGQARVLLPDIQRGQTQDQGYAIVLTSTPLCRKSIPIHLVFEDEGDRVGPMLLSAIDGLLYLKGSNFRSPRNATR